MPTSYADGVSSASSLRKRADVLVYSEAMSATASASSRAAPLVSWSRIRFTLLLSLLFGFILSIGGDTSALIWIIRAAIVGLVSMFLYGLFDRHPKRLPRRLPRSVLQLVAIAVSIPFSAMFAYALTSDDPQDKNEWRQLAMGYAQLTFTGILFVPWIAVGAMLKQRDAFAREQALAFELERSELERNALDARLRLLQAQVAPHFLFNTLANVRMLVESGSPQATHVLESLIAYLRAAVPRLDEPTTTLGQELDLVRAYLDVMRMRIPDRLQFALRVDPLARSLQCPPMTVLTLVENAVRHGIDPNIEGGRIDVDVILRGDRCIVRVSDTGVGLQATGEGLGTGLSTLRERLQLAFGPDAQLRLFEVQPHGVCAELDFPARGERR